METALDAARSVLARVAPGLYGLDVETEAPRERRAGRARWD